MRFLLFVILSISGCIACDYLSQSGCGEFQRCVYVEMPNAPVCLNVFDKPYPLISFPFSNKRIVTCDQGPHMAGEIKHSHAWFNAMDALDLRTDDIEPAGKIYAGMNGKVAIYYECETQNDQCGEGFGNQVKIFNSEGFLLFYSHLDKVFVKNEQEVKEGDLIGLEGSTGWTGKDNRHLHMSVHADWREQGITYWSQLGWLPRSIPFEFKVETVRSGVVSIQSTKTVNCIRRKFNNFLGAALRGI